ncbi:hypothetical protein GH741_13225 [Aquibacillus halophilus]|uniref:Carboxypeptidase regulatory-like domain-containing protein n=1 Tax=Aquibacillus halophilus TaxID=930132 RepID=A0A6A8DD77_9BACI|nr:carboxypeptidase-like regulatory domain-containing protein [Aquibacillus halophilus]MRH43633.1 hypothetical protein [Aquibacillus halophilus]
MKVKIKVKYLILLAIAILILAVGITQWLLPSIQVEIAEKSTGKPFEETENIIELLNSGDIPDYKRLDLIEEHLIHYGYTNSYDVEAGPSMRQGPTLPLNATRTKYVEWYVENSDDKNESYFHAVNQLAYSYAKQGELQKAQQFLTSVLDSMDNLNVDYWNLYKTRAEVMAHIDPEQAIIDIDKAIGYPYLTSEFTALKTHILKNQGNYQQALTVISETDSGEISSQLANQKRNLENWEKGASLQKVQGNFTTSNGDPISFAKVYLRVPGSTNHSIMPEEEIHYAVTDAEGSFTIAGVPRGYYQVHLGIDINQMNGYKWAVENDEWLEIEGDMTKNIILQPLITTSKPSNYQELTDDEVHFEWEPVEGAAYYQLGLGLEYGDHGSSSSPMGGKIEGNKVTIPVELIFSHQTGISFDENEDGDLQVIPESLLAFANPNADLYWYVEAYDKEGNLITASNGFRLSKETMGDVPYFKLKQRKLTNADQLLLNNNISGALEQYKKALTDDPNNLHALRMVERIVLYGDRDKSYEEARTEARAYTEKLAELTNSSTYWFSLSQAAFANGKWDDYFKYSQKVSQALNGDMSDYSKSIYAIALMKNAKLGDAEEHFQEIMESDNSNRFLPAWTALRLYQSKDFESAKQLTEDYPILSPNENLNWASLIERLRDHVTANSENKLQFERGLELYMSGKETEFEQWLKNQEEGIIKSYFTELSRL